MKRFSFVPLIFLFLFISCKNEKQVESSTELLAIENGLLPAIQVKGEPVKNYNIMERMELYKVPGLSMALVEGGKIKWAKGYGIANETSGLKVDEKTIFQAGSISKPVAALAVLKLVEEGKLDLDQDVNVYLKDWQIPDNEYTKEEKVTLRKLLTHTAGMTVHGFPGYMQSDTFPTIIQVLNGEGNTPKIVVDTPPGSIWRYSGGGYTLMEKVVEDVSGMPFELYMEENILKAIGMDHSTYEQPLGEDAFANASAAYDQEGKMIEGLWHNYPEQAAAGLWTTPGDLAKYCIEIQEILKGKENAVLSRESVEGMLTKHKNDWGLGPSLIWDEDSLIFQHGGKNAGFTNNMLAFANRGEALIVMTNADNGNKLIGEIMNAVSGYYGWGISEPRIVEAIPLSMEQLEKFAGKYKLDFQVPDIGDYIVDVSVKNGKLYMDDSNNDQHNVLTPLEEMKFLDMEKGDEILFEGENESLSFLWNYRFRFHKIEP